MTVEELNQANLIQNRINQLKEQQQIWEQGKVLSINVIVPNGTQTSINLKNVEMGKLKDMVLKNITDKIVGAYIELEKL